MAQVVDKIEIISGMAGKLILDLEEARKVYEALKERFEPKERT